MFEATGCGACHTPTLTSAAGDVPLYSDLLLHDMGPALSDNVIQGSATGTDWRTTPLWGLGARTRFLHDGRAASLREAVMAMTARVPPQRPDSANFRATIETLSSASCRHSQGSRRG